MTQVDNPIQGNSLCRLLQSLVSTRAGLADTSANTTTPWPKIPPTGRRYFLLRILRHVSSPHHFKLVFLVFPTQTPHPTSPESLHPNSGKSAKVLSSDAGSKKKDQEVLPT
jgi:hypothetical protein